MTAMRRFFHRIRPGARGRTAIYLVLTAALLFGVYAMSGGQPVTYMRAVRRAEQAELLGPGEVLEVVNLTKGGKGWPAEIVGRFYTRIYVLKERDCMALAVTSRGGLSTDAVLIPVERREGMALGTSCPMVGDSLEEPKLIFAFDEYPEAVRAELTATYDEEDLTQGWYAPSESGGYTHRNETGDVHLVYTAEARREDDGVFIFSFNAKNRDNTSFEGQAEERLFMLAGHSFYYGEDMEGRWGLNISVSFFDARGDVIAEEKALWGY